MVEFDDAAMAIIKQNQQARSAFHAKSSELVSSILADTDQQLDGFNNGLASEFQEILEGAGEDPAAS